MSSHYNANEITIIRESLGLNKSEFAQRLGTHRSAVQKWESGVAHPSNLAQEKLEKAMYYAKNREKEIPYQF